MLEFNISSEAKLHHTTEDYLRVDVTQRIGILHGVTPPQLQSGKFRPPDKLIASLRG